MEETGKNKKTGKLITADFQTEPKVQTEMPVRSPSKQTNPNLYRLFKLTHTELAKYKENYRSFSNFKPEDLR